MGINRIAIVGNGGTGKTTLALRLGKQLGLPVFHTDKIIWQPGWQRAPEDEVRRQVEEIIAMPAWIFDGMGPLWTADARMRAAELVIFLDYPYEQCVEWALKRQDEVENMQEPDLPEGLTRAGTRDLLLQALERVEREFIPQLREWAAAPEFAAKTWHLHSPQNLETSLERGL